jgi:hypothetical protein
VTAGLDKIVFDEGDDLCPQSMQLVIYTKQQSLLLDLEQLLTN